MTFSGIDSRIVRSGNILTQPTFITVNMSALLFGNGTDVVHWKPSSNTRGTFDILTTCAITMLLCVWTAVHLNVSPPEGFWKTKFRKIKWLLIALVAPEMVAYTAWYVRYEI